MVYAVIDTNVFVSALLTKTEDAATVQVFNAIADGRITPLYHKDILMALNLSRYCCSLVAA